MPFAYLIFCISKPKQNQVETSAFYNQSLTLRGYELIIKLLTTIQSQPSSILDKQTQQEASDLQFKICSISQQLYDDDTTCNKDAQQLLRSWSQQEPQQIYLALRTEYCFCGYRSQERETDYKINYRNTHLAVLASNDGTRITTEQWLLFLNALPKNYRPIYKPIPLPPIPPLSRTDRSPNIVHNPATPAEFEPTDVTTVLATTSIGDMIARTTEHTAVVTAPTTPISHDTSATKSDLDAGMYRRTSLTRTPPSSPDNTGATPPVANTGAGTSH